MAGAGRPGPVPHDGTRRPILVNGAEVSAIIALLSCRAADARNTDISTFDMQQRRAGWMIVALASTLLARWRRFCWRVACSPRSNGWSRGAHETGGGDFYHA